MNLEGLLSLAGPLMLAALGGLVSEYAGLLNIGLEGFMLLGAFAAVAGAQGAPSWGFGLAAGLSAAAAAGLALGGLMAWSVVRRRANVFIIGLAVNMIASSLVSFAGSWLFHTRSVVRLAPALVAPAFPMSLAAGLAGLAALGLFWWHRGNTVSGLRLRVLGSETAMLAARGIGTDRLKAGALLVSAVLAALAGALLSLRLGAFVPNQSSGLGWIALVLVFIGGRHPGGIIAACLGFVVLEQISLSAQAGQEHPALLVGLPYLLVFGALLAVRTAGRLAAARRQRR
jgi:simple sugar transport system permease protein